MFGNIFGFIGYFNHLRQYPAKAEKYYAKGLRMGGMSPKYEGAYGVLLLRKGNFEKALACFDSALSKKSCKAQMRSLISMNRAIAQYKLGRPEEAVSTLEKLHKNFRGLRVYQTLGYIYTMQGMFAKAEPFNLEACEYDPEDAVILDNTGQMYLEMGQFEKAKGYIVKAYGKKHISDVLYHMGIIAEHEGRPQDALSHYREATTKNLDALNDVTAEKLKAKIDALREQLGVTEEEEEI